MLHKYFSQTHYHFYIFVSIKTFHSRHLISFPTNSYEYLTSEETKVHELPAAVLFAKRRGPACVYGVGVHTFMWIPLSVYVCNAKTIKRMRFVNKTNYNKGFHPRDDFFEGLGAR